MTKMTLAAQYGGTVWTCPKHHDTKCAKCAVPLHVLCDADGSIAFPDAGSLVGFMRANYDRVMGR